MTLEQLLSETLRSADDYAPSPDLFAKVQRSIDEDRAHRRRVREVILWLLAGAAVVSLYVLATASVEDGRVEMPFASLEILVTAIMIVVVAVMGPSIRRFGETYERAVFAGSPETGSQVLRLLDVAYYLVFGAYIVMTLQFQPPSDLPLADSQFTDALFFEAGVRLGGLFLLMGVLHVALLLALPVVGLVHSANLRRARIATGAESTDAVANKIDRAITVSVWIVAALVLFQLLTGVLGIVIGLGAGG